MSTTDESPEPRSGHRGAVLFLTTILPSGRKTGSEVATQNVIEAIRETGYRVRVIGYSRPGEGDPAADELLAEERPIETDDAGATAVGWLAAAVVTRRPYTVQKYRSKRYAELVAVELESLRPALVVVDHAACEWTLDLIPAAMPVVHIAHNVEHRLYREAAERGGARGRIEAREARLIEAAERRMTERAAEVWTLTPEDREVYETLSPGARTRWIPLCSALEAAPAEPRTEHDIGTLGSWTWAANAQGLTWFANEVAPLLRGRSIVAAGAGAAKAVNGSTAAIDTPGRVPDALGFLAASRVIAVPSTAGAGVQVKTLDAIATGRPAVVTGVATRGLGELPGTVACADSPSEFAAALERALELPDAPGDRESARRWTDERRLAFAAAISDGLDAAARG